MGCGVNTNISTNDFNQFHSIINHNSELFTDKAFPPENSSIFGLENLEKIKKGQKIKCNKKFEELIDDFKEKNIIWKRAKDIFNNQEYTLFSSDICDNSIIQGSIGNCYFLTIISCLTKFPSIIYQLFNSLNISSNGYYEIKLRIANKITIITLDDYFPYNIKTNMPLFCKPYKNEIWVMLLEKAWAKINDSYLNIDNGSPYDVLDSFLLSSSINNDIIFKSYYINNDNKYDIWENIIDKIENKKYIMMICLSKDKISNKKKLNNFFYSIIEKHYYNILEISENNENDKILKLRNPWGFNLKNEYYNKKKNEFDFIIDDDNKSEKNEDEYLIGGGDFLIDYKYFCYLFQEIQIYEINEFSFSHNFKINEKQKLINLFYLNIMKSPNKELEMLVTLKLENIKENSNNKDINLENNEISLLIIIIDIKNISIINRINQKINIKNKNPYFSFMINQEISEDYYFCILLLPNIKSKPENNYEFNIIFQSQDYFDLINNEQFIQKKEIYDIIKNEFGQYNIDFKYDNKNINDIFKDIDDISLNQKYLKEKYPKEMKLLMELSPMNDNKEKIMFRDKYYYNNNNYYLGEQLYNGNIRHGRGIYFLNKNGNKYIGYNEYDKFIGEGKLINKEGNIKEGEFINGKFVAK